MNVTQGERIKMLREEKKMTLEAVAKQIGVSRATVYKYETGAIANIPNEKFGALAELFGVSEPFLKGWSDHREMAKDEPFGIAIPDGKKFIKAYSVMSMEDRAILVEIFQRAYDTLERNEKENIQN